MTPPTCPNLDHPGTTDYRCYLIWPRLGHPKIKELRAELDHPTPEGNPRTATLRHLFSEPNQHTKTRDNLPKSKEPPVFEGKSRASYDNWVRALERAFRRHEGFAEREDRKVDFAADYIGKLQQDYWERHVDSLNDQSEPTWSIIKEVMLNSIGTETERREKAHEKLKKATLGNRTPEELLEELKTLWKELDKRDDGKKILRFYSALL
ncbi:unnamed protein product [Zymoseptoria tritici ST99CH_1A5]|uniref:Retrotransposon gag domain-containing protein n=1 Tax=Zymoseptoria tritici ST99CH_1A5 TaxID=1276529 RepID=A0A1Y6LUJ5_ZYMTR|nr:unnamed protein product [Zymoseptoria tritici ST99CH_1A5]